MSGRVEGTADERRRLHEALDSALELRDSGVLSLDDCRRLNALVIEEIAEPLLRDSLEQRFAEGFANHIKEAGADPADYAEIEWRRNWMNDPLTIGAVRRGLASWLTAAGPLLPKGLAAQLQVALLALNAGEDSWLARIKRGKGQRAKQFTREQFALIFCQEVEYLAALHGWTKGRTFFELTGNRPTLDHAIYADQRRRLPQPPVFELAFPTYERLRRLVPGLLLDIARAAGEGERSGRELTGDENKFLAKRRERLAGYDGALGNMWRAVAAGVQGDSGK